jgi:lysozyme
MNENLHLGKAGEELIKSFESLVLKSYIDTHDKQGNPIFAIGWGHAGAIDGVKIVAGQTITEDEAEKLFLEDAKVYENKVRQFVTVPLNQNQFDALVCMAYNVSTAHFQEMVQISELNKGIYNKVADAMLHFNVADGRILRGLTRRRKEEGELFNKPVGGE